MPQTRQLAAIMFTDIVGYTALMGEDEDKAFQLLTTNRQLQKPVIEKYNGRWIKELGDGILTSFNTVSDAVQAAIQIQESCNKSKEFLLRIGIHHGEVVFDGDDIFGDAVNIASRLQAIAPPGGILISESVHHNVVNKKEITTKYVRTENLKNVKEPVRIYEVILSNHSVSQQTLYTEKSFSKYKKLPRRFILIASVIAVFIAGGIYFLKGKSFLGTSPIKSIAVLPFLNETGVNDMEYLSDGITETLINSLSQIAELSVKARSSVFRYKKKDIDPQQIGDELAVQAILNGRVAQRQDNIILNLELVDVNTGNQIWGEQYNRKTKDLASLQNEIARDVSQKLQQKLSSNTAQNLNKNHTSNSEAYQLYLRGLFHWNKRTKEDLNKAITYFNQAREKDPSFALAYAGLAVTYAVLPSNTSMTKDEVRDSKVKSKAAALKALELDNTLAEPHAVIASRKIDEWDFAGAEKDYKKAIELRPNFATAHQWYSELLSRLGRSDEALAEIKKAFELDPFSPAVNMNLGLRYFERKEYTEAIDAFRKTMELSPDYPMAHFFISTTYFEIGKFEESFAHVSKAEILMKMETPESSAKKNSELRQALRSGGKPGYWRKVLEFEIDLYKKGRGSSVYIAGAYSVLGEKEKAFEWLEKAYIERDNQITYLRTDYTFDNIRSDPRFQNLLQRIGLSE